MSASFGLSLSNVKSLLLKQPKSSRIYNSLSTQLSGISVKIGIDMRVCDVCYDKQGLRTMRIMTGPANSASSIATTPLCQGDLCNTCADVIKTGRWDQLAKRHLSEEEAAERLLKLKHDLERD